MGTFACPVVNFKDLDLFTMLMEGGTLPDMRFNVKQLTNQIALRFPGQSTDTNGRFRDSVVYNQICQIIGVEPSQSELISLGEYLLEKCKPGYRLKRQERRVKNDLIKTLDAHQYELLPLLTGPIVPEELRRVYVVNLWKNFGKRLAQKETRKERHQRRRNTVPEDGARLFEIQYLLNRQP